MSQGDALYQSYKNYPEANAGQEIYSKDTNGSLESQKRAVQIFTRLLDVRSRLLQPDSNTYNTTPDTATLASQGGGGD